MSRETFGWDYPPGVSGAEPEIVGHDDEEPCDWCGEAPCECEEFDNMKEADDAYERGWDHG